ncbi:MAG TPA: hypothetical protein DD755_03275 [Erysipelotrichaceae bacterium]|nr:hypothetical protein [Erysipelotrichaceae bacterium]
MNPWLSKLWGSFQSVFLLQIQLILFTHYYEMHIIIRNAFSYKNKQKGKQMVYHEKLHFL